MADAALTGFVEAIKGLLRTGAHSDLIVTCGGETFNLHKNIVAAHSEFFAKAVTFQVGKEAEDGEIELPEDELAIVKLMVQYFYEADYDPKFSNLEDRLADFCQRCGYENGKLCSDPDGVASHCLWGQRQCLNLISGDHQCGDACRAPKPWKKCINDVCAVSRTAADLITHAKVYVLADKYAASSLKDLAVDKFYHATLYWWDDANFAVAARCLLENTPDSDEYIREIIRTTLSDHMSILKKHEIAVLLGDYRDLAHDLLLERVSRGDWDRDGTSNEEGE
ncbi:hypothetical protein P171DRAFT_489847 [Karstenula rhodostoma CBS 690.94]|uniref:BTB domain-containing protein n=1 Tax=Karstenula rhodostoma CBS 690.94 TaxID=1392251 RepID=A0A9P4PBI2_9PLEO|nr:hypothetical protein P171DRAFT_489847 [Karstenula rhodostoma CBS 690.94]